MRNDYEMKTIKLKKNSKLRKVIKSDPEIKFRRKHYNDNLKLLEKRFDGLCSVINKRTMSHKTMAEHSNKSQASMFKQAKKIGII